MSSQNSRIPLHNQLSSSSHRTTDHSIRQYLSHHTQQAAPVGKGQEVDKDSPYQHGKSCAVHVPLQEELSQLGLADRRRRIAGRRGIPGPVGNQQRRWG